VRLESWVPGAAVIKRADVVLFHGGYGTTMETVRYGTPSVVIPFHSEQEANGRRLEASGAARVLLPSREPPHPVSGLWKGGKFVILVQQRSDLTAQALREAIATVLEDERYAQNAQRLSRDLSQYEGSRQAVDLIEALIH
jgi:UDP:flavonoid glycosyltransferase YjiC (YdhE family)